MSKTKNQTARNVQTARRDHEESALMWLGLAQKCSPYQTGAREMNLALASLAMDAADRSVIDSE